MTSPDRPIPRRRAVAAPDEAAGATPIDSTPPPAPEAYVRPEPTSDAAAAQTRPAARGRGKRITYAQLNVRLAETDFALFEAIQEHDGTSQVDTVRQLIAEAAKKRRL